MMSDPVRTALLAAQQHPALMSPLLLEYFLRGEMIGRMEEKGLSDSPLFGALADEPAEAVAAAVAEALAQGWLVRGGGFYPALRLSPAGEAQLGQAGGAVVCQEAAPEASYRAYHRWRARAARSRRTPPYRILPNPILTSLATRRPQTLDQLLEIPGLGKRRALRYQAELIAVGRELAEHLE